MPTQDDTVLSEALYAEVANAALKRATTVHTQLALAIEQCALLRWFDVEVLAAYLLCDLPAGEVVRHMQALHLVQPHPAAAGRWLLLSELRTALLARPTVQDQWLTLHARAAAAFRQRLDAHPASGDARFRDTSWRDLAVEWVYHLLHHDPITGWHQIQLTCAQAFAIPTSGARWEVDFCVQFLSGLAWPLGSDELDQNITTLKAGFSDLAAYRDSQALPVVGGLAAVTGLTAAEESGIRGWAGAVYLRDVGNVATALACLHAAAELTPEDVDIQSDLSEAYRLPGIWAGRLDLAERHARQAMTVAPTSDAGYLAMGYLAQAVEDWAVAEDWFRQAVAARPDVIDGHLGLSEVAAARRAVDAALAHIDAALAVNPGIRYYALIRRGHVYRDAGRDTDAEREYELARRETPDHTDAYLALGDLCAAQGRSAQAESWYEQALQQNPADPDASIALANLTGEDDTARAITTLEQALASGVRTKGIYYALGNWYRTSGQVTEVARIQQALVQLDGEEAYGGDCAVGRAYLDAAWRQTGRDERDRLLDQATVAFSSAQARDARRAWAYAGLAEVAVLRDAPADVEQNLLSLQARAPWAEYDSLVLIGQAYKDLYAGASAAALLDRATSLCPDRLAAWQTLADLYAWQGDLAAIGRAWEQIVRIDPAQTYAAHVAAGDAYQRAGNDRRARDEYTIAETLNPQRATAVLSLAGLDDQTGHAREAAAAYQRAAELAPNLTAMVQSRLAGLLLREGDDAAAEKAARAAIAANPRQLDGYVELARLGVAWRRDDLVREAKRALLAATGERLAYDFDYAVGEAYRDAGLGEAAHAQYAACIARDPLRVDAYVGTGLACIADDRYFDARQALEQALALNDTRVDVYAAWSRLHAAQGNVAGVSETQARLLALQPTMRYDALLAAGAAHELIGQYDEARVVYEAAIQQAPWRPDAYASLAVLLRRANQPQAAEQAYRQARELAGIAYVDLAWFYQQHDQLADAERVYHLAIAEEPTQLGAYTGLIDLLIANDRATEVDDLLDGMAQRVELTYDARLLRARLWVNQGRQDEAIAVYRDAIEQFPQRTEAYLELVMLYVDRGDLYLVEQILRQGLAAQPEESLFLWNLARLADETDQPEEARRWFLKAGKLGTVDADASVAFQRAAEIALQQGRRRAAHQALKQALQRNPENARAWHLLGGLFEQQHKLPDAAAAYARATEIAPKFGEAYRARGRIYGRLGDVQRLDAMAQQVLALNPDQAYAATLVVADAYRQASEYRRAEEAYRQAISLQPQEADAILSLASLLERQERLAESAALYQQAAPYLDDPKAAADAWYQAGRLLVQMAQYPAAETAFTAAIAADPGIARLHHALGDLYERTGDLERATASYDQARRLNPNDPDIYLALAQVAGKQVNSHKLAWVVRHVRALRLDEGYEYDRLLLIAGVYRAANDHKRAVLAFQRAIAAYPRQSEAYWQLIRLWLDQERVADALDVAVSMLDQPDLTVEAWIATGSLYAQGGDLPAAEEAYLEAIASEPDNGRSYLELARFYEMNDRLSDAVTVLRRGMDMAPGHVDLLVALAERLSAQGQRNDAIGLLQRAARWASEPADVSDIHWRIGDLWLQEGYADRAEQAWRRALSQNPDHAGSYLSLGQLRERAGRMDEALTLYARATEVAPKYGSAYVARGHILAARGDLSGITHMAQEIAVLYLDGNEAYRAHLLVASTYAEAGFYEAAVRELDAAIALDANNPEAHIQLGGVYEVQQQWGKARTTYERVGQLAPDLQRSVALRVAQLHVEEGNLDAAVQAFQKGIELAPDEPDGYFGLAQLYENQGQLANARATYAQMLSRGPAMASLGQQALGTLAERQGDLAGAEEAYRQAVASTPQDARGHLLLAGFYESNAQWDKAVAAYRRAAELDPSQATNALLFTADIQRQLGRTDELRATCSQVIALVDAMVSPDYHALRQRGLAFAMQGDFANAEKGLRQALLTNPDDFQTHFYLAAVLTYLQRRDEAESHLAEGIRRVRGKADLVYARRELEVAAAHEPPAAGAAEMLERLRTAGDQLP